MRIIYLYISHVVYYSIAKKHLNNNHFWDLNSDIVYIIDLWTVLYCETNGIVNGKKS